MPLALAAHPAMAPVAASLAIRNTTSSVSNRFAYKVKDTQENQIATKVPTRTSRPCQVRSS